MINTLQVLASYGGYSVDPYWADVLVLFDCDAARIYNPQIVFGDSTYGWVAQQEQSAFLAPPEILWYHSPTVDGEFQYTGKTGFAGFNLLPAYTAINTNICMTLIPGGNGPILFTDATIYQIPRDIVGSITSPGPITTNIPLKGTEFIASDGTNFYAFGSITNWTTPNEVYKSTDNGATWILLGVMSGTTFPFNFDGTTSSGDAVVKKVGSRWFMVITIAGTVGGTDGRRLFYTDSTDPVTGWTAATGVDVVANAVNDQLRYPIVYDGVSTHYITRSRLNGTPTYTTEIYRSTDGGASWTLDYTLLLPNSSSFCVAMDVSDPTPGGIVRATISGAGYNKWLEHVIGDPVGVWTERDFGNTVPAWLVPVVITPGATEVFINAQNSNGVAMGSAQDLSNYIAGALTYTIDETSILEYNPTPNMLYSRYDAQLAGQWYITRFPAYPLAYIDTSFYKWGTVPGARQHDTAPGSLRCNGGRTYSNLFTQWNLLADDWTIEFWMYTNTSTQTCTIFNVIDPTTGFGPFNFMLLGGNLSFFAFDNTNSFLANMNSIVSLPTGSWQFVTAERSGGTITLYLNGTSVATSSFSPSAQANWPGITNHINFGAFSDGAAPYYGWLDDIRVTKGVARYAGNFAVPTQPFPERGPV